MKKKDKGDTEKKGEKASRQVIKIKDEDKKEQ